jgi:oxygen-independent coproporphyrinogen-3 oxidase
MIRRPPASPAPAGLYIHFPFCASRCSYCDFAAFAGRDDEIERYLKALEYEILESQRGLPASVETIYIGGGTPSRLGPERLFRILTAVGRRFEISAGCEITLECNPDSVDGESLLGFRQAGVTRVSIGLQSLDDRVLAEAGRPHDSQQGRRAIQLARETAGLEVGTDLIAGLPAEDLRSWDATVAEAAALGIDHLSVYLLETDKKRGTKGAASQDDLADAYRRTVETLQRNGFQQYEISNFARCGRVSRHNMKYWTDVWYGGFGLGAHSYYGGRRRANSGDLDEYLRLIADREEPLEWRDRWEAQARLEEAVILGLRMTAGFDLECLGSRYEVDLGGLYRECWSRAEEAGLLERRDSMVKLTLRGRLLSNELFADLLSGERIHEDSGSC